MPVPAERAQDHGCTDDAVRLLLSNPSPDAQDVTIKVTTRNLRIKNHISKAVLQNIPIFHVSYCGTDKEHPEVFSFVAKEPESNQFFCFVFKSLKEEKSYALALSLAKAFYLAYQIVLAEQGKFPESEAPPRDTVFEPQTNNDTMETPARPDITTILQQSGKSDDRPADTGGFGDLEITDSPQMEITRPSTSDSHMSTESIDEDFVRLAKARSNPDILRSTLDTHEVTTVSFDALKIHADPASVNPSPAGSPAILRKPA